MRCPERERVWRIGLYDTFIQYGVRRTVRAGGLSGNRGWRVKKE